MLLQKTRQEPEADLDTALARALELRDKNPDWLAARATLADLRRQLEAVAPADPLMIHAKNDAHDRRVELQRAIDTQTRAVQALDTKLSTTVCAELHSRYRQLVERLGRALREVGQLNDELADLSETLGRQSVVAASGHLYPLAFLPAGRLRDEYSAINLWYRDAREHGLLTD